MAVILLYEADGLADVEILELSHGDFFVVGRGLDQQIHKQVEMADLVERGVFLVLYKGHDLIS